MMPRKTSRRFEVELQEFRVAAEDIARIFNLSTAMEEMQTSGLTIVLQNKVAGVRFAYIPQDGPGWYVLVGRLVDGIFPTHPVFIELDTVLHYFDIRRIAKVRSQQVPELAVELSERQPLTAADACLILERCCGDIFLGDFSIFPKLHEQVMQRVRDRSRR